MYSSQDSGPKPCLSPMPHVTHCGKPGHPITFGPALPGRARDEPRTLPFHVSLSLRPPCCVLVGGGATV